MAINIRQKGQNGEREIQRILENVIRKVMLNCGECLPDKAIVQRNQNQTAVGGSDLVGTFGLAIEIKRQEQLNINTWWKQCEEQAENQNEHPVLLFRQNGKKWRCITKLWLVMPGHVSRKVRAEIDFETFLVWFEQWVANKLVK